MAWFTGFHASRSAALLSMCRGVGLDILSQSSDSKHRSQTSSFDASVPVIYSVWVDDVATVLCCFDIHNTAPPECIGVPNQVSTSSSVKDSSLWATGEVSHDVFESIDMGSSEVASIWC